MTYSFLSKNKYILSHLSLYSFPLYFMVSLKPSAKQALANESGFTSSLPAKNTLGYYHIDYLK